MNFSASNSSIYARNKSQEGLTCFLDDPVRVKLGRVLAYSALILVSLAGNVLIMKAFLKHERTRKTITYFVVNMAAANLVITTVYMPRLIPMFLFGITWFVDGTLGFVLCKMVPFVHGVAILASILNLLASSLDTFRAVVFPMKTLSSAKAAKIGVFLTWALSIIARLPYLVALRTKIYKGRQICSSVLSNAFSNENSRDVYYVCLLVIFYAVPWVAIFCSYTIVVVVLRTRAPGQENATAVRRRRARSTAVLSIIKMMFVITFVYFACWLIYFLAKFIFRRIPCSFRFWRLFFPHLNCVFSPVVVLLFNTSVRRGIIGDLMCIQRRRSLKIKNKVSESVNRTKCGGNQNKRASTGLTANRQMAKNLTVNRRKSDNYTVNCHSGQTSKPISAVKCLTFSLNQELKD
ncbi:substance-P receptor-like [Montipora foliosa]